MNLQKFNTQAGYFDNLEFYADMEAFTKDSEEYNNTDSYFFPLESVNRLVGYDVTETFENLLPEYCIEDKGLRLARFAVPINLILADFKANWVKPNEHHWNLFLNSLIQTLIQSFKLEVSIRLYGNPSLRAKLER